VYTLHTRLLAMALPPHKESETVSFRLSGALLTRLTEDAAARGASRGEHARALLISVLQDEHRLQVLEDTRVVRDEVRKLRSDVALTLEAVLLNIGKVSEGDVRAFVSKNLRS